MKFTIGNTTFFPKELLISPIHLAISVVLFIVFCNVITGWVEAISGNLPYGSFENFQTRNGEFEQSIMVTKGTTKKKELAALNDDFIKFKKENPQYKDLILYRTSKYYDIHPWMFWKWYRYFENGPILEYPYLAAKDLKHN